MRLDHVPLNDTGAFSGFFIDYIQQKEQLKPFYNKYPSLENFDSQLREKSGFSSSTRKVLQQAFKAQYQDFKLSEEVSKNIELIGEAKTFTVTTGHQLNIFTGPLFFIYKIVTVINMCRKLKSKHPDHNFVPVFWMASEDHDYEEIKSFKLYGKKYVWETNQKGAVGRFDPSSIQKIFGDIPGDIGPFRDAYLRQPTLAMAVRSYVNELFGSDGLLVVDGDSPALKQCFKEVIADDLFKHTSKNIVDQTNASLEQLGYKVQVFVRDINLFFLDMGIRARIDKSNDDFTVVDSGFTFKAGEIKSLIETSPEKFSPNVILRPLYQEMILPNLAYVGGPAEMIYWLQLKGIFAHFKTPFPILLPRNFAMVAERNVMEKWKKTGLDLNDLFKEENFLFNHWTLKNTHHDLTVGKELQGSSGMFDALTQRAANIDKTLGPLVSAEATRVRHGLERIEKKMLKAEKRLHADRLRQIKEVKDALFPGGGLQERVDNFLGFYQKDPEFIPKLLERLDPLDFRFNVLTND